MGILRARAESEQKTIERRARSEAEAAAKREEDGRAEMVGPLLGFLTKWSGHVVNVEDITPVPDTRPYEWRVTIDGFHLQARVYSGDEAGVRLWQNSDTGEHPQATRRIDKPIDLILPWAEATSPRPGDPYPSEPGQ